MNTSYIGTASFVSDCDKVDKSITLSDTRTFRYDNIGLVVLRHVWWNIRTRDVKRHCVTPRFSQRIHDGIRVIMIRVVLFERSARGHSTTVSRFEWAHHLKMLAQRK